MLTNVVSEHLCSKVDNAEWIDLDELAEIIKRSDLSQQELEDVLEFLRKYFIEVDEGRRRARLKPWARSLFGVSIRDFFTNLGFSVSGK